MSIIAKEAPAVPAAGSGTTRPAMYSNCPRCGLSIELRSRWLVIKHCPRCIARAHAVVEMLSTGLPTAEFYANDSLPQANVRIGSRPTR